MQLHYALFNKMIMNTLGIKMFVVQGKIIEMQVINLTCPWQQWEQK